VGQFIFRTVDATWQSVEANSHELAFLLSTSTHRVQTTIEVGKFRTWGDLQRYLTEADEVFGQILQKVTPKRSYPRATKTDAKMYHLLPINFHMSLNISIPPADSRFWLGIDGLNPSTLLSGAPLRILDHIAQTLNGVWLQCFCDFPNGSDRQPLPLTLLNSVADLEALAAAYAVNDDRQVKPTETRFVYC
jgi:hypothetical protein